MILSLSFSSSRFFYMIKKPRQKCKYFGNKKNFQGETKGIFTIFEGLSLKEIKVFFERLESNFKLLWNFCIPVSFKYEAMVFKFTRYLTKRSQAIENACCWSCGDSPCKCKKNPMEIKISLLEIEAVVRRCSVKKVLIEISQNSQESTCARDSFLIKFKKESLAHVFSYEFLRNF